MSEVGKYVRFVCRSAIWTVTSLEEDIEHQFDTPCLFTTIGHDDATSIALALNINSTRRILWNNRITVDGAMAIAEPSNNAWRTGSKIQCWPATNRIRDAGATAIVEAEWNSIWRNPIFKPPRSPTVQCIWWKSYDWLILRSACLSVLDINWIEPLIS